MRNCMFSSSVTVCVWPLIQAVCWPGRGQSSLPPCLRTFSVSLILEAPLPSVFKSYKPTITTCDMQHMRKRDQRWNLMDRIQLVFIVSMCSLLLYLSPLYLLVTTHCKLELLQKLTNQWFGSAGYAISASHSLHSLRLFATLLPCSAVWRQNVCSFVL
jgi:hypothetical protein